MLLDGIPDSILLQELCPFDYTVFQCKSENSSAAVSMLLIKAYEDNILRISCAIK
jgi:hypothetical protein